MSAIEEKRMPFLKHLEELRLRILKALVAAVLAGVVCYNFAARLFDFLKAPLHWAELPVQLIGLGPAEAFVVKLKTAVIAGFVISLPYSFLQLWRFISPGLLEKERKLAVPFICSATLFFLGGLAFCYLVVLPFAFRFFLQEYQSISASADIRIDAYLSFILGTALVFGIVFEMPVLTFFLVKLKVLSKQKLVRWWRAAIVGAFVIGAVFTPPDVVSQCLLAGPLVVLYLLCIAVAHFVER